MWNKRPQHFNLRSYHAETRICYLQLPRYAREGPCRPKLPLRKLTFLQQQQHCCNGSMGPLGAEASYSKIHTLRFLWRTNIQDGVDHCFLLSVRSMKLLM